MTSPLVKRLRAIADEFYEMCGDIHVPLREAAARIEALEAAAAQPSREAELVKALEDIALLDEADGHLLSVKDAFQAVAIATKTLGKHPATITAERFAAGYYDPIKPGVQDSIHAIPALSEREKATKEALEKLLVKFAGCARSQGNGADIIDIATEPFRAVLRAYDTPATPDAGQEEAK